MLDGYPRNDRFDHGVFVGKSYQMGWFTSTRDLHESTSWCWMLLVVSHYSIL